MEVVDVQIHVWEENTPERPWDPEYAVAKGAFLNHGPAVTIERAVGALDAVGVDAALVTTFLMYADISYGAEAAARHPDRFRVVPQIDLRSPAPERLLEDYREQTDVAAVRIAFLTDRKAEHYERLRSGGLDPLFAAAARHRLPVMMHVAGDVLEAGGAARRYPDQTIIVDHLGIVQGPHREQPKEPFARLDELLSLAQYEHVAVKITGAPMLSTEPYPYRDLWPPLHRILDAFGPERVLWGSDFSRTRPHHSYAESLHYIRDSDELSDGDKELVLGQSLRRLLRWPRERTRREDGRELLRR